MFDEGVESRSDGIHRIHWKRTDSVGKVHDLFVRGLKNIFIYLMLVFDVRLKERVMTRAV